MNKTRPFKINKQWVLFYKTKLINFMQLINMKLARWAGRKYKEHRTSDMKAIRWLHGLCQREPYLFAHWKIGSKPTVC